MQREVNADTVHTVPIHILGVNAADQGSEDSLIVQGRTIPWLQDTTSVNAWTRWGVTWRDVFILNTANHKIKVYNLTTHDLNVLANYDTLKTLLLQAAR